MADLEQIAHICSKTWIPASAGMTRPQAPSSVMPAQAGIQTPPLGRLMEAMKSL